MHTTTLSDIFNIDADDDKSGFLLGKNRTVLRLLEK